MVVYSLVPAFVLKKSELYGFLMHLATFYSHTPGMIFWPNALLDNNRSGND
jgi:hypothetical protein